jgi:hypothetical protein
MISCLLNSLHQSKHNSLLGSLDDVGFVALETRIHKLSIIVLFAKKKSRLRLTLGYPSVLIGIEILVE